MASSKDYLSLRNVVVLVLVIYLSILPFKSGESEGLEVKMALGSSPPKCVNKCLGCRPCRAALVISPPSLHIKNGFKAASSSTSSISIKDESYYLLAWKCRCRNRYFQP